MNEPRILALETATDACSAALCIGGDIRERFEIAPRRHAALLLVFIDSLMAEAGLRATQLDAVAFGRGPGSFTGLRIAAGMAQGIAFGAQLPVLPVSTLAALAQGCLPGCNAPTVLAALDARMGEVYFGAFSVTENALVSALDEEQVCAPEAIPAHSRAEYCIAGDAWRNYAEAMRAQLPRAPVGSFEQARPHAADVARLARALWSHGAGVPAEQAAPVYLRNNVAVKSRSES